MTKPTEDRPIANRPAKTGMSKRARRAFETNYKEDEEALRRLAKL